MEIISLFLSQILHKFWNLAWGYCKLGVKLLILGICSFFLHLFSLKENPKFTLPVKIKNKSMKTKLTPRLKFVCWVQTLQVTTLPRNGPWKWAKVKFDQTSKTMNFEQFNFQRNPFLSEIILSGILNTWYFSHCSELIYWRKFTVRK